MFWQWLQTDTPISNEVIYIVLLFLLGSLQIIAKMSYIFCKVKKVSALYYYKLFSPYGLIKSSHHLSLLSPLPSKTLSNYPILSTGFQISTIKAAGPHSCLLVALQTLALSCKK
jgi:hypothetical protein